MKTKKKKPTPPGSPGATSVGDLIKYLPMLSVGLGSMIVMLIWNVWSPASVLLGYSFALIWAYVSSKGPHGFAYGGVAVFGLAVAWAAWVGSLAWGVAMLLVCASFASYSFIRDPWKVTPDAFQMWISEFKPPKTKLDHLRLILTLVFAVVALVSLFYLG